MVLEEARFASVGDAFLFGQVLDELFGAQVPHAVPYILAFAAGNFLYVAMADLRVFQRAFEKHPWIGGRPLARRLFLVAQRASQSVEHRFQDLVGFRYAPNRIA